jgi:hypothetical protein
MIWEKKMLKLVFILLEAQDVSAVIPPAMVATEFASMQRPVSPCFQMERNQFQHLLQYSLHLTSYALVKFVSLAKSL